MQKKYILAPGPTEVPAELLLAGAQPTVHHRTKEFDAMFMEVSNNLKPIFKTKQEVYITVSSGSGAMEAAVTNTLSAGDKAFVVDGGKFGERWGNICKAYGVAAHIEKVEWGKAIDPKVVDAYLKANPDCKAVFTQLSESSTATAMPIKELAAVIKNYPNTIFVVDAISGLGAHDIRMDEWGVDIIVSGSQKALMMPPGLAFISLSDKAWKCYETSKLPKFYFDLKKYKKNLEKSTTPWTMAVNLVYSLKWALDTINKDGIDKVLGNCEKLATALRAGAKALGLEILSSSPVNGLTAIMVPAGVDGKKLKSDFYKKFGITIAGGQDHLEGKIIRISHMGYVGPMDMMIALSALEMLLKDQGYNVKMGAGVAAAEEILRA